MKITVVFFTVLVGAASVFGSDPAWLHLEKGRQALRQQEFGIALNHFRTARDLNTLNADADFSIGLVYEAEQNLSIAKRYYLQALSQAHSLYAPSDVYLVQYRLASVHWTEENYLHYENQLREIVDVDRQQQEEYSNWTATTARNVLLRGGIDRLGLLFRLSMTAGFYASRELGAYLVANGRDTAIDALLVAYVQGISLFIENIKLHEPDFQYESLEQVVQLNTKYDVDAEIAKTVDLFAILYYLALSISQYDPSSQSGIDILNRIAQNEIAGRWSTQASLYLERMRRPLLEELVPRFPAAY